MEVINLKYGCNPHQKNAKIYANKLPIKILNGNPGYINLMDALNSYQLVREIDISLNLPAAASFKHVSPAGASVYYPLSDDEKRMYFVKEDLSDLAVAYTRSRGADRLSSFGDFVALSRECDESTAKCIKREVSDGVIAPSFTNKALDILKSKRKGSYTVIQIDKNYVPSKSEKREIFGVTFEMDRNSIIFDKSYLKNIVTNNKEFSEGAIRDLTVASISAKYTQSNSVCYAYRGQTIGVGAGGQSRIHCTRLAGEKADKWLLRTHPKVLSLPFKPSLSRNAKDNVIEQYLNENREINLFEESLLKQYFTSPVEELSQEEKESYLKTIRGVSLSSDAFFPFEDNIIRANRSGVDYIVQPGGSIRDESVIKACDDLGIVMAFSGLRLFHH